MHKFEARLLSACLPNQKSWIVGVSAMITQSKRLGLHLGTEAPVIMPDSADFSFLVSKPKITQLLVARSGAYPGCGQHQPSHHRGPAALGAPLCSPDACGFHGLPQA